MNAFLQINRFHFPRIDYYHVILNRCVTFFQVIAYRVYMIHVFHTSRRISSLSVKKGHPSKLRVGTVFPLLSRRLVPQHSCNSFAFFVLSVSDGGLLQIKCLSPSAGPTAERLKFSLKHFDSILSQGVPEPYIVAATLHMRVCSAIC